jgi:poly(beta-D-mannuronate) lyase
MIEEAWKTMSVVPRRDVVSAALRYTGVAALAAAASGLGARLLNLGHPTAGKATPSMLPSEVIDLSAWKISLPYGVATTQVTQPDLNSLSNANFRVVTAVQFTVPVDGTVQPGANYPRSELREMDADGTAAAWSTTSGTHTMEVVQRITHLPKVKPQLVAGQIHDANGYVMLIRLDGGRLQVIYDDREAAVLDPDYRLGTTFILRIVAGNGFIDVYHNQVRRAHVAARRTGCYFKAGCYLQTNPSMGDAADDYGQVEILSLHVSHSG